MDMTVMAPNDNHAYLDEKTGNLSDSEAWNQNNLNALSI